MYSSDSSFLGPTGPGGREGNSIETFSVPTFCLHPVKLWSSTYRWAVKPSQ